MKAVELAVSQMACSRNIPISLNEGFRKKRCGLNIYNFRGIYIHRQIT